MIKNKLGRIGYFPGLLRFVMQSALWVMFVEKFLKVRQMMKPKFSNNKSPK